MATQMVQRRNIVLLGKTGAGKSTVANQIAGHSNFKVKASISSVTSKVSHTEVSMIDKKTKFNFNIIDTIGFFDIEKRNADVMYEIKEYFQNKLSEGVNLVLFIFKEGRFTKEEKQVFDFIIRNFTLQIADISALTITGCETHNADKRKQIIQDFEEHAKDVAKFMKRGIFTVGFPDTNGMIPALQDVYKSSMEANANCLRELAISSGEIRLAKEMFVMSFWENLSQCVLF